MARFFLKSASAWDWKSAAPIVVDLTAIERRSCCPWSSPSVGLDREDDEDDDDDSLPSKVKSGNAAQDRSIDASNWIH